jgi:hypothetical protein
VREGEVLAIRWPELDLASKVIHIRHCFRALNRNSNCTDQDRGEPAVLRLPDLVVSSLIAHRERQLLEEAAAGDDWVDPAGCLPPAAAPFWTLAVCCVPTMRSAKSLNFHKIRFHDFAALGGNLIESRRDSDARDFEVTGARASTRTTEESLLPCFARHGARSSGLKWMRF